MTLWTPEIAAQVPELYATEDVPEAEKMVHVKFFAIGSGLTWYVTEASEVNGETMLFGYVHSVQHPMNSEWGYTLLRELESLKWHGIPRIERDLHFKPQKFKALGLKSFDE